MKVTYIHHSSFLVELESCVLLFDYFKGEIPTFDITKKLYVFSSHGHADHFSPNIFKLKEKYNNISYILSDDISTSESDIIFIGPNEKIKVDNLNISTLESSDLGVAFIVNVEDHNIYHAGDLNHWHWNGEPDADNDDAKYKFEKEIIKLKSMSFDLAFLLLDPRQEDKYYLGIDKFMSLTNTKNVFPMHFWGDYTIIDKFILSEHASNYKNKIHCINYENQQFTIK